MNAIAIFCLIGVLWLISAGAYDVLRNKPSVLGGLEIFCRFWARSASAFLA